MKSSNENFDTLKYLPTFSRENIDYWRVEKKGYLTVRTKAHPELNDLILNKTTHSILNYCDGKRSIGEIVNDLSNTYPKIGYEIIKRDVIQTLDITSRLQLIKWYPDNPFVEIYKLKLTPALTGCICAEEGIDNAIFQLKSQENLIQYHNPLEGSSSFRLSTLKREMYHKRMFSFAFYLNDKICALFIFRRSEFHNSKIMDAHYFAFVKDMDLNCHLLDYIDRTLLQTADIPVTGLRIFIDDTNQCSHDMMTHIKDIGFQEEAILQKETSSGANIIVLRHSALKPS